MWGTFTHSVFEKALLKRSVFVAFSTSYERHWFTDASNQDLLNDRKHAQWKRAQKRLNHKIKGTLNLKPGRAQWCLERNLASCPYQKQTYSS